MARNNWESWGWRGCDVIQSRQQKQLGYFTMRQVNSWKVSAVVFLRIRSKFELNSSVKRVCQLVVVLRKIATTVQTREKEFLYIILLPAAVLYQVGRDRGPHIARTSTQPAVLLFAPSISLMNLLPGLIMCEDPWNILYRVQFPQYGRKKNENERFFSRSSNGDFFLKLIYIYFFVTVAHLKSKLSTLSFARRKHDILVCTYSVFHHTHYLCLHAHVKVCFM